MSKIDNVSMLTFVKFSHKNKNGLKFNIYMCECGNERTVREYYFKTGYTKSCGCLSIAKIKERSTIHGHTIGGQSRTYKTWSSMISRCTNTKSDNYKHYGGKGISVCDRWLRSFESFLVDMGDRPKDMSLDRIKSSEGYCKKNCRWASKYVQARNKRIPKSNTSGSKGVSVCNKYSKVKYLANIGVNKKRIHLGTFDTIKGAIKARKQAEEKYWK